MSCWLLVHFNSGYTNVPKCYVIHVRTFSCLYWVWLAVVCVFACVCVCMALKVRQHPGCGMWLWCNLEPHTYEASLIPATRKEVMPSPFLIQRAQQRRMYEVMCRVTHDYPLHETDREWSFQAPPCTWKRPRYPFGMKIYVRQCNTKLNVLIYKRLHVSARKSHSGYLVPCARSESDVT
jgi:hypothetical protein